MSTITLFDQEPHPSRKGLWLGLTALGLILLAAGAWLVWRRTRRPPAPVSCAARPYDTDCLQLTLANYLSDKGFTGPDWEQQILGQAQLELYLVDTKEIFLSLPEQVPPAQGLAQALLDPSRIEVAQESDGRLRLGKYSLVKSRGKAFLCKTPVANLRVEPDKVFTFPLPSATYRVSLRELSDFIGNRSTYNGLLRADTGQQEAGRPLIFFNHGAFVAKPDEPSLKRLVAEITAGIPADDPQAREKRIQRMLDLASQDIAYDSVEATNSYETLKRPNETLMSRESDCSNKAILLASLLEQLGEDYLLLYVPEHITVGVKQGQFPTQNGLTFRWEGIEWVIAEATLSGFQIGLTRVQGTAKLQNVKYVQRPKIKNLILSTRDMQALEFR